MGSTFMAIGVLRVRGKRINGRSGCANDGPKPLPGSMGGLGREELDGLADRRQEVTDGRVVAAVVPADRWLPGSHPEGTRRSGGDDLIVRTGEHQDAFARE